MAKFAAIIGYGNTIEVTPGVWQTLIDEKTVYGELIKNSRRLEQLDNVNDNINISNQVSILADPYAAENFYSIRYVKIMGVPWKVTTVDVEYPRLILSLGGVYNDNEN